MTYLWARTVPCSNPGAEERFLCSAVCCFAADAENASRLTLDIDNAISRFAFDHRLGILDVKKSKEPKRQRGPANCPFCGASN